MKNLGTFASVFGGDGFEEDILGATTVTFDVLPDATIFLGFDASPLSATTNVVPESGSVAVWSLLALTSAGVWWRRRRWNG